MRKLLATTIKNSEDFHPLINRRLYAANSTGVGDIPENPKKPFVVMREMDTLAYNIAKDTNPDLNRKVFQFYVHDERGSYSRIDRIIELLRETVRNLSNQQSPSGARCLEATWNGTSEDLDDPSYDSNVKFATFTLVSSK